MQNFLGSCVRDLKERKGQRNMSEGKRETRVGKTSKNHSRGPTVVVLKVQTRSGE